MAIMKPVEKQPRVKMNKSKKNDKKLLIVAQEIKLAKILAGNNKTLRDRTLRKLKKWFIARESQMPFSEDDFLRIWKGLFYYMWMSDKPLIQEECANNIAQLVDFNNEKTGLLFFKCFLKTMRNEWFGIDYLRLDKFLMLVRRVLRQALVLLQRVDWDFEDLKLFQNALAETVLKAESETPLSLSMHVAEIYLEELAKVSKGDVSEEQVLELLRPFAFQLSCLRDARHIHHVKRHVFQYMMMQSDAGIEHQLKFDAWKRQGFPGGSIDTMEKVEIDNEDDCDELGLDDDGPLDPRAGKVDVNLPQLQFKPDKVADMLFELKYRPSTSTMSKKVLDDLITQLRQLSKGDYPLGLKKIKVKPNSDSGSMKLKSSLKRLQLFEKQIAGNSKKAKSKIQRKRKIKEIVQQELHKYPDQTRAESFEEFVARSEANVVVPKKKTLPQKIKTKIASPEKQQQTLNEKPRKPFQKQSDVLEMKKLIQKKTKRKNVMQSIQDTDKRFRRNSGMWEVADLVWNSPKKQIDKKEDSPKTHVNVSMPNLEPLKTDEIVLNTPKNNNKIKSVMVKNPFSSKKKVKIALDLNRSQDTSEYHASLVSSPGIPYDAEKKPTKPLLKSRLSLPSAVNPFYRSPVI